MDVAAFIVTSASVMVALGVWRQKLRPFWRRLKAIHTIIERELTPNGGSSMKDAMNQTRHRVARLDRRMEDMTHQVRGIRASVVGTAEVLDSINTKNHAEHERIWDALATLGFDRRRRDQ